MVTQVLVIWVVLVFAISVIAFITKESKFGSYDEGLALSIFQGFLIGTIIAAPIAYCILVLGIKPFN